MKPVSLDRRGERWKEESDKRNYRGGGKEEKKQGRDACPESSPRSSSVTAGAATGLPVSGFTKQPPKIIHHREQSLGSKMCLRNGTWQLEKAVFVLSGLVLEKTQHFFLPMRSFCPKDSGNLEDFSSIENQC